jgi:hypothetical protein
MTWNTAAETVVNQIDGKATYNGFGPNQSTVKLLRQFHSSVAEAIENGLEDEDNSRNVIYRWVFLGSMALTVLKDNYGITSADITELLIKKQTDYGPENINRFGQFGLVVRTHDKVARLENLLAKGINPYNESVIDTYMDIVGYSAIGIMVERGWFNYPLA